MTREQLINFAEQSNISFSNGKKTTQVYSCKAWIVEWDNMDFALLKSYETIVGVYYKPTGTMYVFDKYSATTYKHIYKACRMVDASRITWLYRRFDGIIETGLHKYINTHRLDRESWRRVIESDFSVYIGSLNRG